MSRSRLVLLGCLMVLAASAYASASASALHLYAVRCNDKAANDAHSPRRNADNGQCEGSLNFARHLYELENFLLKEGELLGITSTGGVQTLEATIAGVGVKVVCKKLDNEGSVENPTGGGAGKGKITVLFLACGVEPTALKCAVTGEMFTAPSLHALLEGTEASPVVKLTPKEGAILAEIKIEKCASEGLNATYKVTGSALAKLNNNGSSILTFKEEKASSMLEMGGSKAGLEGEDLVIISGGGAILAGV
jgi:hypothetical protein